MTGVLNLIEMGQLRQQRKLSKLGQILSTCNRKCAYCGRNLKINTPVEERRMTRDHIVPKSKGGTNSGNLLPACRDCNLLKGAMTVGQFKDVAIHTWKSHVPNTPLQDERWGQLFRRFSQDGPRFHFEDVYAEQKKRNTLRQAPRQSKYWHLVQKRM